MRHLLFMTLVLLTACTTPNPMPNVGKTQPTRVTAATTPTPAQEWRSNIVFGKLPANLDPSWNIETTGTSLQSGGGPTRISGGERFRLQFVDFNTRKPVSEAINSVRLIVFSASGQGSVLVRSASGLPGQPATTFNPLVEYSSILSGSNAQNKNGNVMLANGDSVTANIPAGVNLSELHFVFETFANSDATLVIQFIYTGTNPRITEEITRQIVNPPDSGGGSTGGDDDNTCVRSGSCQSSLYQCVNGQCVESLSNPCDNGAHECASGETCCSGTCVSGGSSDCQ